jgi:hypothetical protein
VTGEPRSSLVPRWLAAVVLAALLAAAAYSTWRFVEAPQAARPEALHDAAPPAPR